MEWFEGNVNDALNDYQQKQGILVVYIYEENNQNSNKFDELWNSFDISSVINQTSYIAIRLLKNSEGAQQFAQFFPTLTIPVCYILGLNAQPLEVITALQELSADQLNASFSKALSLYNEQLKESEMSKSNKVEDEKTEIVKPDSPSTNQNAETANEADSEATNGMTKEEKLAYYRKLIDDKKVADAEKEKEDELRKEIQRRNEGKAMAEIRDKRRDKELKESAEARRKQKDEDAALLKKLREQLKADKDERAKRNKRENNSEEPKVMEKAATSEAINKPVNTDECRIQCRFPDGSTLSLSLPSKEPLQVVYDAVNMDSRKPNNFFLVQPYPRRKLTEMNKSLLSHGLTPSSVILVIANENPRGQSYSVVGTGYMNMLLGIIYFPFVAIYQFFMSLTNQRTDNNKQQSNNATEVKTGKTLKDGNFQRFNNDESDHSDNEATWNGNSTQQL